MRLRHPAVPPSLPNPQAQGETELSVDPTPRLVTIVSAPFDQNAYLAFFTDSKQCLIVDPGFDTGTMIAHLDKWGLTPAAILNTHGHADHIAGNAAMKKRWPNCPLVIGKLDAPKLSDPVLNMSESFGMPLTSPDADLLLGEGDVYEAAGFKLLVREIPGHSVGHIVFIWSGGDPGVVFAGDVLFQGSIGRTDLPGGSFEQLAAGIHEKLFNLPDATIILPGHGEPTTIGEEKRGNPFVGEGAGRRF